MADTKDNKQLELLVQSIANKMNSSPALNGGFDKMMVIVEHIQEKQEETASKVGKIHDGLYDPDEGLYARVKVVESATKQFMEKQAAHLASDEKNMAEINASLKKFTDTDTDLEKKAETTMKLKRIAGEDLEKLDAVIKVKTTWSDGWQKVFWLLIAGGIGAAGKALWEALAHR